MATFPGGQASIVRTNKESVLPVSRAEFEARITDVEGTTGKVLIGTVDPVSSQGEVGDLFWNSTTKMLFIKDADGWNIH